MDSSEFKVVFSNQSTLEEHEVVVTLPKRIKRVHDMIDEAPEIVRLARIQIASDLAKRMLDNEASVSAEDIADGLSISSFGKHGELKLFSVEGTYSDYPEGGTWAFDVMAVDHEDAEFQAKWHAAENENCDPDECFEGFLGTMSKNNVIVAYDKKTTVTLEEMADCLTELLKVVKGAGIDGEAVEKSEAALVRLGCPMPEAAPTPGM